MLKKIFNVIKKVVFYSFLLYGYNLVAFPLGVVVPINLITVGSMTIFGVPALLSFIVMFIVMF